VAFVIHLTASRQRRRLTGVQAPAGRRWANRDGNRIVVRLFGSGSVPLRKSYARFPPFRCRASVAVSLFYRCKIPLLYKNYVRKFRSVRHRDITQRQRQRYNGMKTAKRQRKNGNGMVETGHKTPFCHLVDDC